jgi:hypothetical protein
MQFAGASQRIFANLGPADMCEIKWAIVGKN